MGKNVGKDSGVAVLLRALCYGLCMGGLTGGPGVAIGAAVVIGAGGLSMAVPIIAIGGVIGAFIGLVFAIVPGLVMAVARDYLRLHLWRARILAALVCGLLFAALMMLGSGGLPPWTAYEWESDAGAFALVAAIGAASAGYVVTGRKCFVARRVFRMK